MASIGLNDAIASQAASSENESANLTAFYIPCIVIVAICMVLRVVSRKMVNEPLRADDFALLIGAVCFDQRKIEIIHYVLLTFLSDVDYWRSYRIINIQ